MLARAWRVQLPYSHHQRKKRLFRFLSNTGFDTMAVQTALLGPVCQAAKLRGLVPVMIDWSDLGQERNGLFAAACFRGRGLPLLSWVSTPEELDPSQNRVEEFCIGRLLRHLPTNIRPLLLADRGFGRASLIRFVQSASGGPRHTGYPVDYVIRLKGDVVVQSADYRSSGYRGRLRDYRLRKGRIVFWPQTLYRSDGAAVINLVLYWARGHRDPWYLATSLSNPRQAVKMYRKRMRPEQYFKDSKQPFGLNRSTVTTTDRLQSASGGLVGLLLACCLLILLGMWASPAFRRWICSRGKLDILHLGYEYYLATRDPPHNLFAISHHQTGYA